MDDLYAMVVAEFADDEWTRDNSLWAVPRLMNAMLDTADALYASLSATT